MAVVALSPRWWRGDTKSAAKGAGRHEEEQQRTEKAGKSPSTDRGMVLSRKKGLPSEATGSEGSRLTGFWTHGSELGLRPAVDDACWRQGHLCEGIENQG